MLNEEHEIHQVNKIIYVAAPACIASGGPELLHQLCFKLNHFGFAAKMLYYANSEKYLNVVNPVHSNYEEYHNPYTQVLVEADNVNAVVVIPEGAIELVNHLKQCQKIIWWLSVDNYYDNIEQSYGTSIRSQVDKDFYELKNKSILHFVQSQYARDFVINDLKLDSKKVYYLSDYLRKEFFGQRETGQRKNYCLYNPKKGIENIKKIAYIEPDLGWVPITNMTAQQVVNLMCEAKVYLDFGNHPGKDRIPREAAMCGLCVITNKEGSAAYSEDVSIENQYKFENIDESAEDIVALVQDIYENFEKHSANFLHYRSAIEKEEQEFDQGVIEIFKEICNCSEP
jgi:hypothetical protein